MNPTKDIGIPPVQPLNYPCWHSSSSTSMSAKQHVLYMDYNPRTWSNFSHLSGGLATLNILGAPGVVLFLAVGLYRFGDGSLVKEESFDSTFGVVEFSLCMISFTDLGGLPLLRTIWLRGVKLLFIPLEGLPRLLLINPTYWQQKYE